MGKRILILGGSYFLGKHFLTLAASDSSISEIHVLNRGSRPLPGTAPSDVRVKHFIADRHRPDAYSEIANETYDAVIDFCAYEANDVRTVLDGLKVPPKQYVLVSTVDVLARGTGKALFEDAPFETRELPGEAGAYIRGKVALEQEVKGLAKERAFAATVIRPVIIYGPDNYAPREGMYFRWILGAGQVLHPSDATGSFQMVYVKDVARFLKLVCGNEAAYGGCFHLCGTKSYTYNSYVELLEQASGKRIERVLLSVRELLERGIPLPFPFFAEESERYGDTKSGMLGFSYTPDAEAMGETFRQYVNSTGVKNEKL